MKALREVIAQYKKVCGTYPQTARILNISEKLIRQIENGYTPKINKVQTILERAEIQQTTIQDCVLDAFDEYQEYKKNVI
jgi:hypothetical protein